MENSAKTPQTYRSTDSVCEIEANANLQKALGSLINEFCLLRELVNTVHADYADLKQTVSKQKDKVKYELSHKIETNAQQLTTIAEEHKQLKKRK